MSQLAFVFPGQGSQKPGMGAAFLDHPIGVDLFHRANERLGFDLKKLCLEGPTETLTLTQFAQPAILTVSSIAYQIFAAQTGIKPLFVAGHSLGEYSALVAAGVLAFEDAVEAVYYRGLAMQEAVPVGVGAMAAVLGMEAPELEALCAEESKGQFVAPANYNCQGQIVISGDTEAVKRVLGRAKGKLLEVSAPFHSPLMAPAAAKLAQKLKTLTFHDASDPVMTNAENRALTQAADFLPSLVLQVTAPVRWETGVQKMIAQGVKGLVEFGEGKVLAGMAKRIDKTVPCLGFSGLGELEGLKEQLQPYL